MLELNVGHRFYMCIIITDIHVGRSAQGEEFNASYATLQWLQCERGIHVLYRVLVMTIHPVALYVRIIICIQAGQIFPRTDFLLLLIFLIVFMLSMLSFCFLVR